MGTMKVVLRLLLAALLVGCGPVFAFLPDNGGREALLRLRQRVDILKIEVSKIDLALNEGEHQYSIANKLTAQDIFNIDQKILRFKESIKLPGGSILTKGLNINEEESKSLSSGDKVSRERILLHQKRIEALEGELSIPVKAWQPIKDVPWSFNDDELQTAIFREMHRIDSIQIDLPRLRARIERELVKLEQVKKEGLESIKRGIAVAAKKAEEDRLAAEARSAAERELFEAAKLQRGQEEKLRIAETQRLEAERMAAKLEEDRVPIPQEELVATKLQREQAKLASRISIQATATNPDVNGDFTINIQTNADTASLKIDGDELGGKQEGNYVIKRVARVGEQNSYKITARDVFGNTDSATVTVTRQVADSRPAIPRLNPANVRVQQSRDAVAIIIGIENYRRVAKADFANADAKEFYTYASRALGIKPENIKLLVDDGADLSDVLDAFQNWLPLKVNKGKTDVYVFYSGHGYPSQDGKGLYFLPFNVDSKILDRTSVKQIEVVAALQRAQAKSVTMFIDACYSGQTRNGEVLVAGIKPVFIKADDKAYPPEFTVITASAADQFSSASPDLKHGIFSFYLMKALEGDADENNDGRLTSGELQRYLSEMVGRQAMGLNRTQNTQLFGNADRVLMTR